MKKGIISWKQPQPHKIQRPVRSKPDHKPAEREQSRVFVYFLHLSTSTAASDRRCIRLQATDWNSREFFDSTRGSFVMTSPPHPVAHSPGERRGTGSCSAGPRRRRSAPGTRWSCSESRPSPQASRFPGRRSAWLPGSQRHIPGKKKEKENNKLAQNCTSVAAVWVNVFARFFCQMLYKQRAE